MAETISEVRSGPRSAWALLGGLLLARIAFGYQLQTVASLGPVLIAVFGIDFASLGTLFGLYMLPGVATAIPSGFFARRFGDRATLVIAMALMTLGATTSATAAGPAMIGTGRVIAGIGAVGMTVLQAKVIADRFSGRAFTLAMGLMVGAFPIGIGLAQLTHLPLAHAFGWPSAFGAGALLAGVSCVWIGVAFGARPTRTIGATLRWPSGRECSLVILAGLIWTAYNAGYQNFVAYMPSYLALHGHGKAVADLVLTIGTWANTPALLIGSAAIMRFGPRPVFMVGMVASVVSIGGAALTDWPLIAGVLFGTVGAMPGGVIIATGTLSTRPENRAVGMGLFYTTYYLGGALLPIVCGKAADWVGDPSGALLAAASLSATAIPFYLLHQWRASVRPIV